MALHSESKMAFLSQESVYIKNSELNEGALIQLDNCAKPDRGGGGYQDLNSKIRPPKKSEIQNLKKSEI